jgi:Zn-dependent protease
MSVSPLRDHRRGVVRPSPMFLAVVLLTALGGLLAWSQTGRGSRLGDFGVLLFVLAGWIVSVCLHEFAHAAVAYRAGDRSVADAGYLSLNPFRYTHPVLSILLPLFFIVQGGIGLPGGAVYLHRHAFRSRAMQSAASAAGPLTNLVLALVLLMVAKSHLPDLTVFLSGGGQHARFWCAVAFLGFLQATAAVLNLLPVPGLDGWAVIEPYLAPSTQQLGDKIKPWGMLGVIVLLLYVPELNNAFFRLVDWLAARTGAPSLLWAAGRVFFRFWAKQPL